MRIIRLNYIHLLIFTLLSKSHSILIPFNSLNQSRQCYQSINDESKFLAVTYNPKFSNGAPHITLKINVNIKKDSNTLGSYEQRFYMKEVEYACKTTIFVSNGEYSDFDEIEIHFEIYTGYIYWTIAKLDLKIYPDISLGLKSLWTFDDVLIIFFIFEKDKTINQIPGITSDKYVESLRAEAYEKMYICSVVEGRSYVFHVSKLNGTSIIKPYHSLKMNIKYSEEDSLTYDIISWPCEGQDKSTNMAPTLITKNTTQTPKISFTLNLFTEDGNDEISFTLKKIKVEKMQKTEKDLGFQNIYGFKTYWQANKCDNEYDIISRYNQETNDQIQLVVSKSSRENGISSRRHFQIYKYGSCSTLTPQ